jgi:hypothetical protein
MTKPVSLSIEIGGCLSEAGRKSLVDAIMADHAGPDADGEFPTMEFAADAVDDAIAANETLFVCGTTSHGDLNAIEHACQAHGLSFARGSSADDEHDGITVLYLADDPEPGPYTIASTHDGRPYATIDEIRAAAKTKGGITELLATLDLADTSVPPLTAAMAPMSAQSA